MIRTALYVYLVTSLALGPAFCCCRIDQFFPGSSSKPCCVKRTLALTESPSRSECHCSHEATASHEYAATRDVTKPSSDDKRPTNSPCDSKCPCGKHDPGILVAAVHAPTASASAPLIHAGWELCSFWSLVSVEISGKPTELDREKPALLSGREILRAYQTLRC